MPISNDPDIDPPDLTTALEELSDQVRLLQQRVGNIEAVQTGLTPTSSGLVGAPGQPGAKGDKGDPGGATLTVCTSTSLPAGASNGQLAFATDTKHLYVYNGSAWVDTDFGSASGGSAQSASGVYEQAVAADGPVGWWKLNEASVGALQFSDATANGLTGNIDQHDGSGNTDYHGYNALPTFPQKVGLVPNKPNDSCLYLPGALPIFAHVPGLKAVLNDDHGQSIEFWAQWAGTFTLNPAQLYHFLTFVHLSTQQNDVDLAINEPGFLYGGDSMDHSSMFEQEDHANPSGGTGGGVCQNAGITGGGDTYGPTIFQVPVNTVPGNAVNHYVYTRKAGGQYKLYINGHLIGARTAGTFGIGDGTLDIGGVPSLPILFAGWIAQVAVYNYELTASQVQVHHSLGLTQNAPHITGVSPSKGGANQGIKITGTGFSNARAVEFIVGTSSAPASSWAVISDTELHAVTPNAPGGTAHGVTADIKVTGPGGWDDFPAAYSYT